MRRMLAFTRAGVRVVSLVLLGLMVVTPLAQIVMRGIFNVPLAGAEELARYFLIAMTFIAAAYVTPTGEARRFDDLGCLTAHLVEQPEPVAEVWVHDDDGRGWLRGAGAWYVKTGTVMTPMGTGLVAVKDEAAARALAARARGEAMTYEAFRALGPRAWPARE